MTRTMLIFGRHAYTSEADLQKHEGVTSDVADLFHYDGEAPAKLWRVEGGPEVNLITADANEALAELEAGASSIYQLRIMGPHDEAERPWIIFQKTDVWSEEYGCYIW